MSKKKQLTGKKTKLANLPLTQALSQQMSDDEVWEPAPAAAAEEPSAQQLPLSWERVEEGAAGLLAATYLLIIQELQNLKEAIPGAASGDRPEVPMALPTELPPARQLKQALCQIRDDLADLSRLLAG
jgi:hypothetical protein